jgi:hypothetical protein
MIEIEGVKIHYTDDVIKDHGDKMFNWMTESLTEIEKLVPSDAWNVM